MNTLLEQLESQNRAFLRSFVEASGGPPRSLTDALSGAHGVQDLIACQGAAEALQGIVGEHFSTAIDLISGAGVRVGRM